MRNPNPQCEHCEDRHDGFYGSYASPCPIHNDDGNPRKEADTERAAQAATQVKPHA